jgi:hypothetical protein
MYNAQAQANAGGAPGNPGPEGGSGNSGSENNGGVTDVDFEEVK